MQETAGISSGYEEISRSEEQEAPGISSGYEEISRSEEQETAGISSGYEEISRSEEQEAPGISSEYEEISRSAIQKAAAQKPSRSEVQKEAARKPSLFTNFLSMLLQVGSIIIIFLLLLTFLFGLVRYSEPSMAPAIKDGDLVLFFRYTSAGYLPQDVIVLEYNGKQQIRRVIATAGDTVDITEEGLVINGALQQELDIYKQTERYQDGVSFPLTVPEGQVFVLGDNREDATDSRIYGCVKIHDTLGKVMTVILRWSI